MKKITLNAEKRNSIANVIETHFRNANSKARINWLLAKNAFNDHKEKIHSLAYKIVRQHQPQEDVDTIKKMIAKYGENSGGQIYKDKCFNFETDTYDDEGKPKTKELHLDFGLRYDFALSYYDDEIREQGLDPDNEYKYKGNKNPHFHSMYDNTRKYLGMHHNNQIYGIKVWG